MAASERSALVVGGGFAGLAAAQVLTEQGVDVVLVEQGRGLGGRVCTRSATLAATGERVTFDHGCQYLTARSPPFDAALESLKAEGALAVWGQGGRVGSATLREDGSVDLASLIADKGKELWVGTPSNSAVGRALVARAGPQLSVLTATRVEALSWDEAQRKWRCRLRQPPALSLRVVPPRDGGSCGVPEDTALTAAAKLESASFDMVVTALSSVSTVRLLGAGGGAGCSSRAGGVGSSSGSGGSGSDVGGVTLAADVVEAAGAVRANVCWALMKAHNKRIDVPFDGALLSRPDPAGGPPLYGPIAWLARDSSKPGRPAVAGGAGEAWVVHGGPEWSNVRAEAPAEQLARELLAEFARLSQVSISPERDVLHLEAHRWNNAYPLNPRPPTPPQQQGQQQGQKG